MNNSQCCSHDDESRNSTTDALISQRQIGSVYDSKAPIYDLWAKCTESRARNRAIALANIQDGQTIHEVAVGTGLAFYEILKRNPNGVNTGIDLSKGMLRKAELKAKQLPHANYHLAEGTAFDLSNEGESIDILLNNYMFDLIPFQDMDRIIVEFKRVLKKNGKLILVNMTKGERVGSGIYEFIYNISPKTMGGCRGVMMSEKLRQHGFRVESREYYQQMLFPSEVILAYKE